MYEHMSRPLLPKKKFYKRIFIHSLGALFIIFLSLLLGTLGYYFTENLPWLDSVLNASMILGGMGPVNEIHTVAGKIFASFYALFSGIVFLIIIGVIFAPLYHRFLHKFHLEVGGK